MVVINTNNINSCNEKSEKKELSPNETSNAQ